MRNKVFAIAGVLLLLLMMAIPSAQAAPNTNRGYYLDGTGYDGLHAIVSTGVGTGSPPAFTFPAKTPDVLQKYVLQVKPHNSCIIASVWYERLPGASTTHTLEMASTCINGVQSGTWSYDLTDATIRNKYVRTNTYNDTGFAFQDEVIELRVILTYAPTNQWTVYAYNFNTSTYDFLAQNSGTQTAANGYVRIGDGGYSQDPTMSCPTLYPWGIMQIRAVQKRVSGSWSSIGSSDITGTIADSWPCISTNNYQERRTIPYQFKIEPYGVSY